MDSFKNRTVPLPDGFHTLNYPDSSKKWCEGYFLDGKRVGMWTFWHTDGTVQGIGCFITDKKHGTWTEHNRIKGNQYVRLHGDYRHGTRVGTWTSTYVSRPPLSPDEFTSFEANLEQVKTALRIENWNTPKLADVGV